MFDTIAPVQEQLRFVSFLDRKTALIGLIVIRERQIELLQEQRTALIVVTRAGRVPMKDGWSGRKSRSIGMLVRSIPI
jgi:hypothetical protein